ncbi:hypothetical protein [Streptomyces mexicanus]|uniref:hypothetical protein n=1 Tax=Streptomyces mexicanus TaxID=178566 RepID=UPI00135C86FF|nr:hypothetical protein [Streptomyces mexicanus]
MTERPYEPYEGTPYEGTPYEGSAYEGAYGAAPQGSYGAPYQGQNPYGQPQGQNPYGQPQPQPQQQYPHPHQHPRADPYAQAPAHQPYPQPQQQAAWSGQQQAYAEDQDAQQYTQQWQGPTWDTQTHARPVTAAPQAADPAAPTAYLSALDHHPAPGHREPTPAYGAQPPAYGAAAPAHGAQAAAPSGTPGAPAGPAAAATAEPAYGPATIGGNARVTDAQRARAEGRSPIIEPGMQPAGLTALLGLLLAGAAQVGTYALLVPLVVLQGVTAAGWFRLNGMWPARQGIALGFAGALVADAAVLGAGRDHAPAAILGTLGVWVLLSLVLQLRSHADPDERMYGLMATVAAAALAIIATGYLAGPADAVAVGAVAVAAAVGARALPLPTAAAVVVALLAAAGAGIAVGGMTGLGAKGALLGAGAAVCALIGHRAASYDYPSRFVHFTAGVALPLAAAAPAVWVLGRAVG